MMEAPCSLVTILARREKERELKEQIEKLGVLDLSVTQVQGCGIEEGVLQYVEDGKNMVMLIPKVKLEILAEKEKVSDIIQTACKLCRTDMVGDGKIFEEEVYGETSEQGREERTAMEKMNKVTIITRGEKFEELRRRLLEIGVSGMTVTDVSGCGVQKGITKIVEGITKKVYLVSKIKVEIVVCKVPVEEVIRVAKEVLNMGNIGDGKIFVSPISHVVRIRTGEEDEKAL